MAYLHGIIYMAGVVRPWRATLGDCRKLLWVVEMVMAHGHERKHSVLRLLGAFALLPLWPAASQLWTMASNSGAPQSNRYCTKWGWCWVALLWYVKEENWHKIATGLVIYSCKHIMIPKTFCELGRKNKPATCILQRGQNCFNKKCLQSLLKENLRLKGIGKWRQ